MEYSGSGPSGVWMLTARPLKQGIAARFRALRNQSLVRPLSPKSYCRALPANVVGAGEIECRVRCNDPRGR